MNPEPVVTRHVLEPRTAEIRAVPGVQAARVPAELGPAQLLTAAALMAVRLRSVPSVLQVVETFDGLCTVVVVVTDARRAAVDPVYRAEIAVAESLPRTRFVVRNVRADAPLDPSRVPGVTQAFQLA